MNIHHMNYLNSSNSIYQVVPVYIDGYRIDNQLSALKRFDCGQDDDSE